MTQHPLEKFRFCPACGSSHWEINNEKSKHCTNCGFVYYANASAAVAALIRNENGDLLVCRRAKDPAKGTLDLPGGFVDMNENIEEAVRREIMEELNLSVTDITYFKSIPNDYLYSGMVIHTLDFLFLCKVNHLHNLKAMDDVSEAFFKPVNTISPQDFGLNSIKKGIIAFLKEIK
ncbi:MAG: NUDIX domain-containing protein [Bacteroidales bacterium]|nr:NUDIX domain-containing protein [Bacteroidales bacterium]